MSKRDPRCQAVLDGLLAAGATELSPPSVLPARTVLELSGESIRSRLCAFSDNSGAEFAMRPDMTTPIATMLVDGEIGAGRYAYLDWVYRLPLGGGQEQIAFEQVGFEWFGEEGPEADAEAFAAAARMGEAANLSPAAIRIGDVGLFHVVVEALDFSGQWASRLKRSFARSRGPEAVLAAAGRSGNAVESSLRLGEALARMDRNDAERAVEQMLATGSANVLAGRSLGDIAERLVERADSALPDPDSVSHLKAYLAIEVSAADAVSAIETWARDAAVDLGGAVERLAERHGRIGELAPKAWESAAYAAGTGRRFEYYDGFAFEFLPGTDARSPVLAGGRYDGVVRRIDPSQSMAAIGCALRADRLPEPEDGR